MFEAIDHERTPAEISRAAERLRQQARWGSWPNLIAGGALAWLFVEHGHVFLAVASLAVFINFGLAGVAYRRAGQGRVSEAAVLQAAVLWFIAAAVALAGGFLIGVVLLAVLLALVSVASFVRTPTLLGLAALSVAIVTVAAVSRVWGAPLSVEDLPRAPVATFVVIGSVVIVGIVGLTVWHTHRGLGEAIIKADQANRTLRDSERSLEATVEQRTSELATYREELVLARDEAVLANERQTNFLANVSHELRTPLNAIIGFSELLDERLFGELNDKQAEYVRDIHESGQHLLSLINDVLDLSSVDTGDVQIARRPFDLPRAVTNALVLMKERAARNDVTLEADLADDLTTVVADERRLKQVLINLLSNAVKFTPAGGSVTLTGVTDGADLVLTVVDTGVGIRPEKLAIIFEEFRQADQADAQEGTGLGLSLSRRLVEAHDGALTATSTPGEGSTFCMRLPGAVEPQGVST